MTKWIKVILIFLASLAILITALFLTYIVITKDAVLDEKKLTKVGGNIVICDDSGKEIISTSLSTSHANVKLESLPRHTIDAFIASEDRNFYKHSGLNVKRMVKAAYKNLISRSFREGASTISQQLIKNTHLSGDKTIERKLKEIKLTYALEKKYSKDDILEMYLNIIYFGHNCYGIESAAQFYFDKKAEDLTLDESAVLVGLLSSPNNYSPLKHPDKSLQRRNLVLKAMRDCNFISENTYKKTLDIPLHATKGTEQNKNSDYLSAVFDELEEIDLNFYELSDGCKIYTYLHPDLQSFIENLEYPCDNSIIISTTDGKINAYKSTIGGVKRQPGSTIKPFAVYAPAIEERQIFPYTQILDEKINFDGYSPSNSDNKYHGYVTVADSLKMSYNIPAVKILNSLTLDRAEKYLTSMDIKLENDEKNLSLALGGMTHGLTLKEITDKYSMFANLGLYSPSGFIKKITSSAGKTIYERKIVPNRVFSAGTVSLVNEMLMETAKSGTAKKLRNFDFDIAAKTGTCGNENGNTDAYCINYTADHCIGVWLGDKNNNRLSVTGGNECCSLSQQITKYLYLDSKPDKLDITTGTREIEIDAEEYYRNNKIILADKVSPKLNKLTFKTLSGAEPKEVSTRFSRPVISKPEIQVNNNNVNIVLCQTKYYSYLINRANNGKIELIYDGKWKNDIVDNPDEGIYEYSVTPYFDDGKNKYFGEKFVLPSVKIGKADEVPQVRIPDIIDDDWYNM